MQYGDQVADTPPQKTPLRGCPAIGSVDTCPGDGPDMVYNVMGYGE